MGVTIVIYVCLNGLTMHVCHQWGFRNGIIRVRVKVRFYAVFLERTFWFLIVIAYVSPMGV